MQRSRSCLDGHFDAPFRFLSDSLQDAEMLGTALARRRQQRPVDAPAQRDGSRRRRLTARPLAASAGRYRVAQAASIDLATVDVHQWTHFMDTLVTTTRIGDASHSVFGSWYILSDFFSHALHSSYPETDVSSTGPYVDDFDYQGWLDSLSASLKPRGPEPSAAPVHTQSAAPLLESIDAAVDQATSSSQHGLDALRAVLTRAQHAFDDLAIAQRIIAGLEPDSEVRQQRLAFFVGMSGAALALLQSPLVPRAGKHPEVDLKRLLLRYDPQSLEDYWSARPAEVMQRQTEIVSKLSHFFSQVLIDERLGRLDMTLASRASELREIIQELGPAFIKAFQAIATRGEVLPEVCIKEFSRLQDNVQQFPTHLALTEIESALGTPWQHIFQWISKQPLAAASLGQVYHGLLREEYGSKEVAIKVQRPQILRIASLDIFIIRRFIGLMTWVPNMSQKWKHLLDGWAEGFFEELDYSKEARYMMLFKKKLKDVPEVKIPEVHVEFSSTTVLTTEWIFGEKFTEARSVDPKASCRVLLNCYLVQLLDIGYLHADPHPGNLIWTNDHKICLLDFGMVARVTEDQKYALIEFITHLWVEDWDAVAADLEHLAFLPPTEASVKDLQLKKILKKIFGNMVHGGGLRVNQITKELDSAAREHQIVIPPYFTLILRAFCIVEGLCIQSTGGFSIVQECLPYLARRLLSDDNDRMHALLKSILYSSNGRLDMERVRRLLYAAGSVIHLDETRPSAGHSSVVDETLTEALRVVLSSKSSLAQKLLVNEAVSMVDGATLEGVLEALRLVLGTVVSQYLTVDADSDLPRQSADTVGVMHMMTKPEPTLPVTEVDRQTLRNIKATLEALQTTSLTPERLQTLLAVVLKLTALLPELLPGFLGLVAMFLKELIRRKAQRLADTLQS